MLSHTFLPSFSSLHLYTTTGNGCTTSGYTASIAHGSTVTRIAKEAIRQLKAMFIPILVPEAQGADQSLAEEAP
jgi:hypothetical protein